MATQHSPVRNDAAGAAGRTEQLEAELDYALHQIRLLRAQLQAALGGPAPAPSGGPRRERSKRALHAALNRIQRRTPAFARALVRGVYLNLFYYRLFPEYAPAGATLRLDALDNALAAHSGYPPFLRFKQLISGSLLADLRGLRTDCRPGLVSVVLPVYNGARYIAHAIESVLAQSYTNFELIVVDDGSTDDTPRILARYAQSPRVRVLRQANQQLPNALNAGFAEASGEFYTWTSADNALDPEMLATLAGFLNANADVEMVYADERLIDEHGRPALDADFFAEYQSPPGGDVLRRPRDPGELNFVQNNYIGACFMYRAWAARCVGRYSPLCFGFEDYDFWMRMNALFRVAHLGERRPLNSYRLHGESLTASDKELRISERARYYMAVEAERRRFFLEPFDIVFSGNHPWFAELASAYRRAGHNVISMEGTNADALYRYGATRAFRKAMVMSDGGAGLNATVVWNGNRAALDGFWLTAERPGALAYPLLAAANSALWSGLEPDCRASR